jgi:hypothetical protein
LKPHQYSEDSETKDSETEVACPSSKYAGKSMATPSTEAKSPHVADAFLASFLTPHFDAADYFNQNLPALSASNTAARGTLGRNAPLSDLASQLQALLSQINAQTSRVSNGLTRLTDDIVRSGGKLVYEVELLRGEVLSTNDAISIRLKHDMDLLAPPAHVANASFARDMLANPDGKDIKTEDQSDVLTDVSLTHGDAELEPEFLVRLRTLTTIRTRLDAVVKVFGSAMQWPVAPSEVTSNASAIISISAPGSEGSDGEEKAKAYLESLQSELAASLAAGVEGLEVATAKVDEMRDLAEVWKGTSEEKARAKVVEGLQKLVDEKAKTLNTGRRMGATQGSRLMDYRYGGFDGSAVASKITKTATAGGYGFLQNLRDFKNEMYAD